MEGIRSYNGHLCQEVCAYHNVERKTRTGSRTSIASIVFAAWLVDPLASRVENNVVSFPWGKFLMKVLRSVCCTDLPSFTRDIKNIWSLSPLVSEMQYQNLKPIDTKIKEREKTEKKRLGGQLMLVPRLWLKPTQGLQRQTPGHHQECGCTRQLALHSSA